MTTTAGGSPWYRGKPWLIPAGIGVLVLIWLLFRPKSADMTNVIEANTRGVGHMEQFNYPEAIKAFEEAARLAPDWIPARINLALALLNEAGKEQKDLKRRDANFVRAINTYQDIIRKTKDKRWITYSEYGLGLIYITLGVPEKAQTHLKNAIDLDENDAHIQFRYGLAILPNEPALAAAHFRKALKLDPYLGSAVYNYFNNSHIKDTEKEELLNDLSKVYLRMNQHELYNSSKDVYSEFGFYGEVIGKPEKLATGSKEPPPLFLPSDKFKGELKEGTKWATDADREKADEAALRRAVRERFGGTMVLLDYDRDGRIDIFMLGAVVRAGRLGNLLLHNEGNGRFVDVTEKAGLAQPHVSLGCTVADFDNDTYPDLFVTGAGTPRLFRNNGKGGFEDVTVKAGLDKLKGVTLASAFVDLDQDGDLDLVVAWWGDTAESALALLKEPGGKGAELRLFTNNGMAFPHLTEQNPPPLEPHFIPHPDKALAVGGPVAGIAVSDVDRDSDVDLVVLADGERGSMILNDRLLRFRREKMLDSTHGVWNGGIVLDVNRDEFSDLLLVGAKQPSMLLMHEPIVGEVKLDKLYRTGKKTLPALLQAQAVDLDLDGRTDVVGLGTGRLPVFLENAGDDLSEASFFLGGAENWPADLVAVVVGDLDGDGLPDVLGWSEGKGLQARFQNRNERRGLFVRLMGDRLTQSQVIRRTNSDGIGTRVAAQTRDHWTNLEFGTLSGGLGQSLTPLVLGMNRHEKATVLRLRWPDNVWQAELDIPTGKIVDIEENNRKTGSCPILMTWNGERFVFVTDFLGAGTLGETQPDGTYRMPRPEESVKIESHQLRPKDGSLVLKIAEPMDEVTYLDRLQLLVVDHPPKVSVFPDERMSADESSPSQDLLAFERPIHAVKAVNHRGKVVTRKLLAWDRDQVDEFALRSWIGFAEEHWVELDFGDQLKDVGPKDRLCLFAAGSIEYPYPESIWAARQAGLEMLPPVLERRDEKGQWQRVADIGYPAGMPRMMAFDLSGKLAGNRAPLRIRTNLHIFWDQLFLARLVDRVPSPERSQTRDAFRVTPLEVSAARLYSRGCMQEYTPDGKLPLLYDPDRIVQTPLTHLKGRLTRYGDVAELLTARDDRFVLIGPGDEAEVKFQASALPALQSGWTRSYVLKTWGYCKDTAPFTATGDRIEPMPFLGMTTYPYGPKEKYPDTPLHREYLRRWNTREVKH